MAIKPILFNTEMVRAILDGRKSCTRRLVKHDVEAILNSSYCKKHPEVDGKQIFSKLYLPPYQPGDILYVRETWCWCPCWDCGFDTEEHKCCYVPSYKIFNDGKAEWGCYGYKASFEENEYPSVDTWRPSIHMPKEAARIWLKVTDVRVERLQEMKPADVIKEGAYLDCWDCLNTYGESGSQCCYGTEEQCSQCDEVMMEWEKLWTSTIKKSDIDRYGWDANPYVWVIEFERCEKTEEI